MKTITKHLKRTETLCENNRKQQLTSTLYWVKFVSYLLLDKAIIILYVLYFNVLCIISILLSKYSLFAGSILSQGNSPKRYCACRILRNVIVSIFYLFAAYRQFVILISRRARYCISFRFLSPFPVSRRSCPYPRTPLRQSCIRVLPENLLQSPGCSW